MCKATNGNYCSYGYTQFHYYICIYTITRQYRFNHSTLSYAIPGISYCTVCNEKRRHNSLRINSFSEFRICFFFFMLTKPDKILYDYFSEFALYVATFSGKIQKKAQL